MKEQVLLYINNALYVRSCVRLKAMVHIKIFRWTQGCIVPFDAKLICVPFKRHRGVMASQITTNSIVCLTACLLCHQREHQSFAIHPCPVHYPHKGPVLRKALPFHDIIMLTFRKWYSYAFLVKLVTQVFMVFEALVVCYCAPDEIPAILNNVSANI